MHILSSRISLCWRCLRLLRTDFLSKGCVAWSQGAKVNTCGVGSRSKSWTHPWTLGPLRMKRPFSAEMTGEYLGLYVTITAKSQEPRSSKKAKRDQAQLDLLQHLTASCMPYCVSSFKRHALALGKYSSYQHMAKPGMVNRCRSDNLIVLCRAFAGNGTIPAYMVFPQTTVLSVDGCLR